MIYEFPDSSEPIRQGDIFGGLPRIEISLESLSVVDDNATVEMPWREVLAAEEPVSAILPIRPVLAIVASQDCDCSHSDDITLCEIRRFVDVERKAAQTNKPSSWVKILTQHARLNLKWFYLPPCEKIGFKEKNAVDFTLTIRVARSDLEKLRHLRKGRLNTVADEHFRERIAEFYRRYPYDEWYPLDQAELTEYRKNYPESKEFPWQS